MNMEKLGQIQLPAPEDFDPHPRLLVHLHPRFYPHLSHRSVRKRIGRDTTSIKCAANKYYILCFLLDTSYILWYNAPVNEFCAISLIGAWT